MLIKIMDKEQAKIQISALVDKYKELEKSGGLKRMSEADTKRKFIEPLFEALGWDFTNPSETVMEVNIAGERADYGFYLNGRAQFYLEAKAIGTDIHREDFAKQAWKYAWNKSIPWAVLSDFKVLKVFNSESTSKKILDHKVLELNINNYLTEFEDLWLLSKDAFLANALDAFAEKIGKKTGKVTVTETLAKDLNRIRQELIEAFKISNPELKLDLIEEGVQKMIDRLIFIRVAEDRGIEPPTLKPILREWEAKGKQGSIFSHMVSKFRELDKIYNSDLFSPHALENWGEYHADMKSILQILYGEPDNYEYDFKAIPADVLGAVYENYLGYKLQKTKKDLFGQDMALGKDLKKRKEQGIYYTPKFIVDYIVKNALGPVLEKCTSVEQLKKIKILDPACGSGSFLVAAFGEVLKKYQEFNYPSSPYLKMNILKENIYGVDLDGQAVQLARLNLLLNVFDSQFKLENLDHNIKNGNSLISGSDEELEKYFGKNYKEKEPFNWQEQFPEVFKQGGFDCIIGNPPWVSIKGKHKSIDFDKLELQYFTKNLNADTYRPNLFEMFIWKSLTLLKNQATFSFVVPDRLCTNEQFKKLREYLLTNCSILNLLFKAEFPGIIGDIVVFTVSKGSIINNRTKIQIWPFLKTELVPQTHFEKNPGKELVYSSNENEKLLIKITKNSHPLSETFETSVGFIAKSGTLSKEKQNDIQIKVLKGENIGCYEIKGFNYFEFKKENLVGGTQDKNKLGSSPKILMRKTGLDLIAAFDDNNFYPEQSLYFIYGNSKDASLALLGCLNSKFMNWYYQNFAVTNKDSTPQLKKVHLDKFPIPLNFDSSKLVQLVKQNLDLKKETKKLTENSNEWQKIKDEIAKTDQKIDQEVYKLYGLTDEEIKIVEGK